MMGDEDERLAELRRTGLLDTPPEERFDRLTRLAAAVLDVPISLLTLVDRDRQWFKSRVGMDDTETARDISFCSVAIATTDSMMVVDDASADPRFATMAPVTDDPGVRFYAGHVLHGPDGHALGTLCVVDHAPRTITDEQRAALADIGRLVEEEIARGHREQLLARLDESERSKAVVLATLHEGLVVQSADGVLVEWNASAERLLGLTKDEMAGLTTVSDRWRCVHPDGRDWPSEDRPSMHALRDRRPMLDREMGVYRTDGSLIWLRVSSHPIAGSGGEPQVLTVFTDISRARDLELALRTSEHLAVSSLDALEQGVILATTSGVIRRLNPAAERLLGYPAAELTDLWQRGAWQVYTEDGSPMPEERRPLLRAAMGQTIDGEVVRWQRKDGSPIILRLSTSSNADGTGGLLITFTDITAEREMIGQLSRFEHLFRHANDLIVVLGPDGLIRYASPSAQRILGYEAGVPLAGEIAGVLGIVHPDDVDAAATALAALATDDAPVPPFTVRVRTREGDWRHLECVAVNLLAEPDVQGIVITARDTTERERLNAQLAHLAAHDPLTDLPNRSVLVPRLRQALARAEREGSQVGLCFVDLDRFKAVNDDLGHAVGDSVIQEVADRLRDHTRTSDTAVRIGGDEFVVIFDPVADAAGAREAADRLCASLSTPPVQRGEHRVDLSIGVAASRPGEEPDDLLRRADAALYRAKARPGSAVDFDDA